MDIFSILQELRSQRDQMDEAIHALERIVAGQGKRRGRPPAWMAAVKSKTESEQAGTGVRKKRALSPEARAKMAAAQRRRWAAAKGESAGA
jgi:hypothetical protein